MPRPLKIILVAAAYFFSFSFTVASLFPELAVQAGFVAVIVAMTGYRLVLALRNGETGLPFLVLVYVPALCTLVGAVWWLMRLVGIL